MYKAFRITTNNSGLHILYGKPVGWFKKWIRISSSYDLNALEYVIKFSVNIDTVVEERNYDHRGQEIHEAWL